MKIGIESLSMYVPRYKLDLRELAQARGVDFGKFQRGIGQEFMSVPAPDEDVVTMGANAAAQAMQGIDPGSIRTVIFATESGVDQSKAAAIYVHRLLGLPPTCRTVEMKQACCSGTSALHFALSTVALQPQHRVLIIASDVARYGLETAGEPTQGGGAVAMVISANPRVIEIDPACGYYTADVMDFWRPNYRDEAVVDGKYSIKVYIQALEHAWEAYRREGGWGFEEFSRFCYHMPFSRMATKAHTHFHRFLKTDVDLAGQKAQIQSGMDYNRQIGNCYTASLYIGLLSTLENDEADLAGKNIGLFSYGSGCMGAFFGGRVRAGYRDALCTQLHRDLLDRRESIGMEQYEDFYQHALPEDGSDCSLPVYATGLFRIEGIAEHKRLYRRTDERSGVSGERGSLGGGAAQPFVSSPL